MSIPIETALLDAINASSAPPESLHQDVAKRLGRRPDNVRRSFATYVGAGYLHPDTFSPTDALRAQLRDIAGVDQRVSTNVSGAPAPGEAGLVPWNALCLTGLNYRKTFNKERLESLAASIRSKGVLTALTVRPDPQIAGDYQIAAGERRFRAIALLIDRGELAVDTPVPVVCRALTDAEALAVALAENMEQETVDPFEEAEGFLRLQQRYEADGRDPGDATGDIASELGCSRRIVQRRLRTIRDLAPAAREAWAEGKIASFAMAEELSRWPEDRQADGLSRISNPYQPVRDASELRDWFNRGAPAVGQQVFDEEAYCAGGGTYADPDSDEDVRRFANRGLAEQLTHDWIVAKAAELAEEHGYNDGPVIANWYYDHNWPKPKKADKVPADKLHAHFVIDSQTLAVSIVHPVIEASDLAKIRATQADGTEGETGPGAGVQALSQRNWTAGSQARTDALQDIVADCPPLAMALAVIALLPGPESWSRSGSKLLHIEGDHRWTRRPLRIGLLDDYDGVENGRVIDPGLALSSLLENASQSDLLGIFANIVASLSGEWSASARPGTLEEALVIADVAESWDDRGHESFNVMDELADDEWFSNYTVAQLGAIADSHQADERAGADDPRPIRKDDLAAWLGRNRAPDWIPPEARFLSQENAERAVAEMLSGQSLDGRSAALSPIHASGEAAPRDQTSEAKDPSPEPAPCEARSTDTGANPS